MLTVRYEGPPAFVSLLAGMLQEEGVEADYGAPVERKSFPSELGEAVVIFMTCRGSEEAIKLALRKFRERRQGTAEVVEGTDPRGYR